MQPRTAGALPRVLGAVDGAVEPVRERTSRSTFATVRAYKFLDDAQRAPFTATPWALGEWVEATGAIVCHEGVHGCRATDVSYWLGATMWELELDGHIVDTRHKVVGSRGRVVRPVTGYEAAVRELGDVGAWRARDRAVMALHATGARGLAGRFAGATTVPGLAALGGDVDDSSWAGTAAALAADAAHFAINGDHAQSPFVAACSAGHHDAGDGDDQAAYDTGYASERAFQSAWLTARLALE